MDTYYESKLWRSKYTVLHQVKDAEEDQRPIGMTTSWSGLKGRCLLKSAEDRRQWRKIVHEAVNPRIKDD